MMHVINQALALSTDLLDPWNNTMYFLFGLCHNNPKYGRDTYLYFQEMYLHDNPYDPCHDHNCRNYYHDHNCQDKAYILKARIWTPTIPQKKLNFPQIFPNMPRNGPKIAKNDPKCPKVAQI